MEDLSDKEVVDKFLNYETWSKGQEGLEEVVHEQNGGVFDEAEPDQKKKLEAEKKVLDDFWDEKVKIENLGQSNEDFQRYKIKDWDVDDQIGKLFRDSIKHSKP